MSQQRLRIAEEEGAKAKRNAALDIEARTREIGELNDLLKQRDSKLAEAQKTQAELIRKERELDDFARRLAEYNCRA